MALPKFIADRPIASTVFAVGAALVIVWALASRAAAPKQEASVASYDPVQFTSQLPDANAQLASATQVQLAQIESANNARALEFQSGVQLATLGVEQTLGQLQIQVADRSDERDYNIGQQTLGVQERTFTVQQEAQNYQAGLAAGLEAQRAALDAQTTQLFAQNQLQAALDANSTARAVSQQNAAAQTRSSSNNLIGTIIGGALGVIGRIF
jgi:hypothetical protein